MSKATLTYNLPEEYSEYMNAVNGTKFQACLMEIYILARKYLKYTNADNLKEAVKCLEQIKLIAITTAEQDEI